MFRLARLKLTGWYLLIIMLICVIFSLAIYHEATAELEGSIRRAELRLKAEELGIRLPPRMPLHMENLRPELRNIFPRPSLLEDLQEAKRRVVNRLLLINGVILVISATAGYFLAGKTLKPIEDVLEEQKRFVADASHELRTPLTALKTSIEVALREKEISSEEAKKILESNLDDINSLQTLADNLLVLAQYQKNNRNLIFKPVEIKELIEKAVEKMSPLAKEKSIEIEIKAENYIVEADRKSLMDMMVIFLDNALKYTPERGKITIDTEVVSRQALIRIEDTGVGIDPEDIPHIFDRFYRVDKSRSKINVPGFGLGLSLAKRIIEMHKGSIDVLSVLNKGTILLSSFLLNTHSFRQARRLTYDPVGQPSRLSPSFLSFFSDLSGKVLVVSRENSLGRG
ncbi:MAG: hypothetical protein HY776_00250 [Actinobacteria bacterium]|nr:hypothetical protein [Actinomycetota bacterium]